MRKLSLGLSVVLSLAFSSAVLAKGGGTPQNHHCVKDGAELGGKTKKECKQAGGKWVKQ